MLHMVRSTARACATHPDSAPALQSRATTRGRWHASPLSPPRRPSGNAATLVNPHARRWSASRMPGHHAHGVRPALSRAATLTHFLLVVVVVGAGQQVPEYELRHVHALPLVHFHRDAVAVVPHRDRVGRLPRRDRHRAASAAVQSSAPARRGESGRGFQLLARQQLWCRLRVRLSCQGGTVIPPSGPQHWVPANSLPLRKGRAAHPASHPPCVSHPPCPG